MRLLRAGLALFSLALGCSSFSAAGAAVGSLNVADFGAKGDGTHLDSPAINAAITARAQGGGGMVLVPAGMYLCGSIHLKSNVELHLLTGAVLLGAPQEMHVYDPAETFAGKAYQDEGHTYFHNSLIWGEDLTNVAITGLGMINGGAMISKDAPRDFGNKSIVLKNCRSILIRDVTIFHGGHFAILATGCDNLTIDNVTIDSNRDGMDLDCCRNTTVSNCRINTPNDDGLCPKSTYALGRRVITENLTIANCQVSGFEEGTLLDGTMKPHAGGVGRIKFGTESSGGFRNVTVANCTFRHCRGLALEEVDGGVLENISVNNITMMDVYDYPIYITLGARNRTPDATNGLLRNVSISDVTGTGISSKSGIQITGLPGDKIDGVRLENIRLEFNGGGRPADAARVPKELGKGYPEPSRLGVMPSYGLFARHVKDLELRDIQFTWAKDDSRPAMSCDDIDGLDIDHFKAQTAPGVPAAKFDHVNAVAIHNSPVLDGVK